MNSYWEKASKRRVVARTENTLSSSNSSFTCIALILLAFFLYLNANSKPVRARQKDALNSVHQQFSDSQQGILQKRLVKLLSSFESQGMKLETSSSSNEVSLKFDSDFLFEANSNTLNLKAHKLIQALSEAFNDLACNISIRNTYNPSLSQSQLLALRQARALFTRLSVNTHGRSELNLLTEPSQKLETTLIFREL